MKKNLKMYLFVNMKLLALFAWIICVVRASHYVCTTPTGIHYVTNQLFTNQMPFHQLSQKEHCYKQCGPCNPIKDRYVGYRARCNPSKSQIKKYELRSSKEGDWNHIKVPTLKHYGFFKGKPTHPFIYQTYLCNMQEKDDSAPIWYSKPYDKSRYRRQLRPILVARRN
jgi:hypothetical protein